MAQFTENQVERIEEFLRGLSTEVDVLDYVEVDDIDTGDAYNSIYDMISDNNGFNIDIIYYRAAINYLAENDPSLNESLALASEYGYEVGNINSELLASLLASQNVREEFNDLESEIENFFEEIQEEIDNVEAFIEEWGQSQEDLCEELGYDTEDVEELLIDEYFFHDDSEVWIPISSSLYSEEEQVIASRLRAE